jgi:hypothetical protein
MNSDQLHVIGNNSCSNAPIAAGLSRTSSSTTGRQGCLQQPCLPQYLMQHEGTKQDGKKEVCQLSNSSVDHAIKLQMEHEHQQDTHPIKQ